MDRARFEYLLEAYGAELSRWPANERAAAAVFLAQNGDGLAEALATARALDAQLDEARAVPDTAALAARILATAPRPARMFNARAALALAACAVLGLVLGYGGGRLAPLADEDDGYFATAFEAPLTEPLGEEG